MHWLSRLACRAVGHSPFVPRHVAFIMDGNRRYAKHQHIHTKEGHSRGYEKLKQV
jgi:ditrans,polycis-polyprenyl diphosphate synthase